MTVRDRHLAEKRLLRSPEITVDASAIPISLSPLDEERFGVRAARVPLVKPGDLERTWDFCAQHHVQFLIARCMVTDIDVAQALESMGAQLMDTLIYYSRDLLRPPVPIDVTEVNIRTMRAGDEDAVRKVAMDSFRGYFGHYHADKRLDRAKCDEVYTSWALRSCLSHEVAGEVLVAELDDRLAGFATLRLNDKDEGEGVLFGVAPFAQGRGIYKSFMIGGMNWCLAQGASRMVVSTQITNLAVQKVWTRLGFEPSRAYYTFHRWFEL